ncbi:MAG: type II toxin-antitoxin system VapC family toxin [Actinomycetota bacterium]|nr:type II toxin-antitoxin system VapC family toxin [Actinomycetota bacterium]
MAIVYFDASAFVKLVVEESGSDLASALWDGSDAVVSSRLAYPEVCAALAAAHRNDTLTDADYEDVRVPWDDFWSAVRPVGLTRAIEQDAGALAPRRALRGADAVHLASALVVRSPELVVAAWDRRLHGAAVAEGLAVAPRSLDEPV